MFSVDMFFKFLRPTPPMPMPAMFNLGITFSNSFDFKKGKEWNNNHKDDGRKIDLQAVAFRAAFGADHTNLRACTFLGWQDTLYLDSGASFLEDCTIKGSIDFIFGSGSASLACKRLQNSIKSW